MSKSTSLWILGFSQSTRILSKEIKLNVFCHFSIARRSFYNPSRPNCFVGTSVPPVKDLTWIWGDPLILQQRLRSVLVQLFLLSSPSQPLSPRDFAALLQNPVYSDSASSVDPSTRHNLDDALITAREYGNVSGIQLKGAMKNDDATLDSTTRYCCVAASYAVAQYCKDKSRHRKTLPFEREDDILVDSLNTHSYTTPQDCRTDGFLNHLVTAEEYRVIIQALLTMPNSQLAAIGKRYFNLYDGSIMHLLQLNAEQNLSAIGDTRLNVRVIPNVHDIVSWMCVGICLSDPFFRVISNALLVRNSAQRDIVIDGNDTACGTHSRSSCTSVTYPLMPSMLLFTWDFDSLWSLFKKRLGKVEKKKKRGHHCALLPLSSHVVYRPSTVLLSAVSRYCRGGCLEQCSWTTLHSLYHLTNASSSPNGEGQQWNDNPFSDDSSRDLSEYEWDALIAAWFTVIDHNLPDNFGNHAFPLGEQVSRKDPIDCESAKCGEEKKDSLLPIEKDRKSLYNSMPHVGVREVLYGSARFISFLSSASGADEEGRFYVGVGSLRHLFQQLLVQHQHRQSPTGGGFYVSLQRLNARFTGDLSASLLLAPISVSRLSAVLQWHSQSGLGATETGGLFRDYSLFYFLLWVGGHPMLHRLLQRQIKDARALEEVRAALRTQNHADINSCSDIQDQSTTCGFMPAESCWDYDKNSTCCKNSAACSFESSFLYELYDDAKVFTPPVTVELLAFFLVLPLGRGHDDSTTSSPSSDNHVLLNEIRGIPLLTLRVVNTSFATPMEAWTAIDEVLREESCVETVGSQKYKCRTGDGNKIPCKMRSVRDQWQEMESHIWCLPYSLLKRRLSQVARAWCQHQRHARIHHNHISANVETIRIRDWVQALLWEKEFGCQFTQDETAHQKKLEVACEMLWSLLFLADPSQEHFKIDPPSVPSASSSTYVAGDFFVTLVRKD